MHQKKAVTNRDTSVDILPVSGKCMHQQREASTEVHLSLLECRAGWIVVLIPLSLDTLSVVWYASVDLRNLVQYHHQS